MKDNTEDNTKAFFESEDGQKSILQERALKLDKKFQEAQAEKMRSKEEKVWFSHIFPSAVHWGRDRLGQQD